MRGNGNRQLSSGRIEKKPPMIIKQNGYSLSPVKEIQDSYEQYTSQMTGKQNKVIDLNIGGVLSPVMQSN